MKIWLKVGLIVAVYKAVPSAQFLPLIKPDSKPFLNCFAFDDDFASFKIGAESVPDLRKRFFDNKATKCVVNGMYILYEDYHFNAGNPNGVSCLS